MILDELIHSHDGIVVAANGEKRWAFTELDLQLMLHEVWAEGAERNELFKNPYLGVDNRQDMS